MSPLVTPGQFSRIAAAVFAALVVFVLMALVTRDSAPVQVSSPASTAVESLKADLERCRAITPEQTTAIESCRRVWSENRQRFLAPAGPAKRENRIAPTDVEQQQGESR